MLTVEEMITYCNQNLSNIKFVNLFKKDLIEVENSYNQDLNMPPASRTWEFHQFIAMSSTRLAMKHISQDEEFSPEANLEMS